MHKCCGNTYVCFTSDPRSKELSASLQVRCDELAEFWGATKVKLSRTQKRNLKKKEAKESEAKVLNYDIESGLYESKLTRR